jgi:hypothetical protein
MQLVVARLKSPSQAGCRMKPFGSSSVNVGSINDRSQTNQPIGGSATADTGVGSRRNGESAGISTPGDFGSQGAPGEGVVGTSGGNQRSTSSERLGSTTGSTLSPARNDPAPQTLEQDQRANQISIAPAVSQCKKPNRPAAPQGCRFSFLKKTH